jgi:hypothetical protein
MERVEGGEVVPGGQALPAAVLTWLISHWKLVLALAVALFIFIGTVYVQRLRAENRKLETEVASYQVMVTTLTASLTLQATALADREISVKSLDVSHAQRLSRAAGALQDSPEWGDSLLPVAVGDVLRGKD